MSLFFQFLLFLDSKSATGFTNYTNNTNLTKFTNPTICREFHESAQRQQYSSAQ